VGGRDGLAAWKKKLRVGWLGVGSAFNCTPYMLWLAAIITPAYEQDDFWLKLLVTEAAVRLKAAH
jgi:hypothetical protein